LTITATESIRNRSRIQETQETSETPTTSLNSVNKHVGSRARTRRIILGMRQEKLGEALGLTFQQVQNYGSGTNGVGASHMVGRS
jgi:hypothetical protein